jgi:hypothetical protein
MMPAVTLDANGHHSGEGHLVEEPHQDRFGRSSS